MKYIYVCEDRHHEIEADTDAAAKRRAGSCGPEGSLYYANGRPVAHRTRRVNKWSNAHFENGKWWVNGEEFIPLFEARPTNPLDPFDTSNLPF